MTLEATPLLDKHGHPRFDIALTMAGAISAGAYTAGVVDFLIEALDAWDAAKRANDADAPRHAVGLKVLSGASAGAITAAILGAALAYDFPHVRNLDAGDGSNNPLFDSWVNMIDIGQLLETRDLADGARPVSLLDSTRLLEIARKAMDYGTHVNPRPRAYLGDPLRFIFTLTNLRGVPFRLTEQAPSYAHTMMMHGDTLRFAIIGQGDLEPPGRLGHNEYPLSYPEGAAKWHAGWDRFALAAMASGAFPAGLAPQELVRRRSDYDGIEVVVPGGPSEPARIERISPSWPEEEGNATAYRFLNVDGGTIDNEPLEHARIALAGGALARNPRDGICANRAVIMIDPFVGPHQAGPSTLAGTGLVGALMATLAALKNQARFRPQDIALANEDTIYSRFLIAPVRRDRISSSSETSIACGSLGGFGGFLHRDYRCHDFLLGRRNCQRFLWEHFTLPEANPLFQRDSWTDDQRPRYRASNGELPIIPLMPALHPGLNPAAEAPRPEWPLNRVNVSTLKQPIRKRLDALFNAMSHETQWNQRVLGLLFTLGWKFYARPKMSDAALQWIERELRGHRLLVDR